MNLNEFLATRSVQLDKAPKAKLHVDKLRDEFAMLQRSGRYIAGEAWDEAVRILAFEYSKGKTPTAQQWVDAAKNATTKCDNCGGSGRYSWGACVNGRMTHSATCFRCNGKGRQNQADYRRNWGYDQHRRVI